MNLQAESEHRVSGNPDAQLSPGKVIRLPQQRLFMSIHAEKSSLREDGWREGSETSAVYTATFSATRSIRMSPKF